MRRDGFSLAEALVVLAITSVLLILLAQVSLGGARASFRLAARADEAGDRLVGVQALRTLLRGVRPPGAGRTGALFVGAAEQLSAQVAPGRPTPCGDGAPGRVVLRIDREGDRTRLVCAGPGRAGVLLDLGSQARAAFSYALAGRPWSSELTVEPSRARSGAPAASTPAPRMWIRFAAGDHRPEVIEAIDAAPGGGAAAGAAAPRGLPT